MLDAGASRGGDESAGRPAQLTDATTRRCHESTKARNIVLLKKVFSCFRVFVASPSAQYSGLVIEKTIATTTHGRYLVLPALNPVGLLVGFHGYVESAETQIERLRAIEGSERWTIISIQGLHRFYQRRSDVVVAGWMTRQDRDLAIADNLAYVSGVVTVEWAERIGRNGSSPIVYAGFSQGVAMAFRAAAASVVPVAGVIAVGGDVPPEIDRDALARLRHVLLCRGAKDDWYTDAKFASDRERLETAGIALAPLVFDGGHEWTGSVSTAASQFLRDRLS